MFRNLILTAATFLYLTATAWPATAPGTALLSDAGKIQGAAVPKPTASENGKAPVYDSGTNGMVWQRPFLFGAPIDGSISGQAILGVTQGYADIPEAIATAAGAGRTVFIHGDVTLSSDIAIPANIELIPLNGAVIHHGSYTVSYAGSTARWPRAQVFNGTGLVSLSSGVVCPEWWTTNSAPGVTEMSVAIQKAVDALPSGTNFASQALGGTVSYDRSRYKVSTRINTKRGVSHIGQGPESTQFMVATTNGLFYYSDTGNSRQDRHIFENFGVIQSGAVPTSGGAVELLEGTQKSQSLHVKYVHIDGTYYGIHGQALIAGAIESNRISSTVNKGIVIDGTVASTSVRISDNYTDIAGDAGVYVKFAAYISIINNASDSSTGRGYHLENIEGLVLDAVGAEQNAGDSQIYIKECSGVTLTGPNTITPVSNLASHAVYLDANKSAVTINGGNFRSQTGNTGYAIYGGGLQTLPVVVNGALFNLGYVTAQVYDQTDAAMRVEFNNCKMADGLSPVVPGLHNQVFNTQAVENLVYGSPGSIVTARGNAERATAYIKHHGRNSQNGWYNLLGFQLASSTPSTGTYTKGDVVWNTAAAPGGFAGWYCTTSGSYGANTASTATTTTGSATVTLNVAGVAPGRYITIAGVTGVKRAESVSGTTVVLDSTCDASVSGAAITYSAPVLKTFGAISP